MFLDAAEIVDVMTGTSTKIRVAVQSLRRAGDASAFATLIVKGGFEEHSANDGPDVLARRSVSIATFSRM